MLELKDEILNTLGQLDNNARYRIRNNNGDVLQDDVQLELKTPVAQQGTALNKSNLEKAIMTRIGRDYVVNGGAIVNVKAHEDIEQGKMVEFRELETPSGDRISQALQSGSNRPTLTVLERINGKICMFYDSSTPNVFKLVNYEDFFKDGLQDKHILGTYTLTSPSGTTDSWTTLIQGVRAYADGTRVVIFFSKRSDNTYYHYVRTLQFDPSTYTLTEMYTSEKIQNNYSYYSTVYGEENDYVYYIGHSENYVGNSYVYHIHLNNDGTISPSMVFNGSNYSYACGFVLQKNGDTISVKGLVTKRYTKTATSRNFLYRVIYTYNTTNNTFNLINTDTIITATDNSASFAGNVVRFNDEDYIRINLSLSDGNEYAYLKFDDDPNSGNYTTIAETAPFGSNCYIFYIKNRMIVFKYSSTSPYGYIKVYSSYSPNLYSTVLCEATGMVRGGSPTLLSSIYEDSFFYGTNIVVTSDATKNALYIFTQTTTILNSEVENTANLRKVMGIAQSKALKGEKAWVYTKPGVDISTDRFEIMFDN